MRKPIPDDGYTRISGNRAPPKAWGEKLFVQLRGGCFETLGWCDPVPWPVAGTRWKWERDDAGNAVEHSGDIVAVRRCE